jgi:hypothetical protein
MSNTARVTSYALQVGGKVTMSSPSNEIGDPSAYLHEAHIGGGCSIDGGVHYFTPCSTATKVYATTTDASPTVLTKPPVDLSGTAASANLGPMHGCDVGSVPWGGFDNNTNHLDQSLGTINLVPATHYDCKALDSSGNVVGEIGWDGTTLTIAGTIFLDGNIAFGQQNVVVYKGKATIYASGSISIAQKSTICGTAACDTTWDTSKNLLAWVAGKSCPAGSGTTESDSFSIANNSIFQGAIYAVCDYGEGNSTTVWGPIIAHQLYMQNSTVNYYVPIGTLLPGMPAQYDQVQTIVPDPGSWSS